MENRLITLDSILRNPKYRHPQADYEVMSENHELLRNYMSKMIFASFPEHPEMFIALFSIERFGTALHKAIIAASLGANSTIWFQEYSEEDKLKLLIAKHIPLTFHATPVVIAENGGDLFVNVFF